MREPTRDNIAHFQSLLSICLQTVTADREHRRL